jgi:ABC-type amino acid transport substrate-binding protein
MTEPCAARHSLHGNRGHAHGHAAITYERYDTKTLKRTIRREAVLCGVNTGLPGFSSPDDKGNWSGFDVDFCRAVAAAIFDDPKKVEFVPLDANDRFKELQSLGREGSNLRMGESKSTALRLSDASEPLSRADPSLR